MDDTRLWLPVAGAVLLAGCASSALPAPRFDPAQCVTDPALIGTWTDSRLTQIGPAWLKVSFGCC